MILGHTRPIARSNRDRGFREEHPHQAERIEIPASRGNLPLGVSPTLGINMELRCDNKLHAHLEGDTVEVRCNSRFCGKRPGVVVIHRFNTHTGELTETLRYKVPVKPEERK